MEVDDLFDMDISEIPNPKMPSLQYAKSAKKLLCKIDNLHRLYYKHKWLSNDGYLQTSGYKKDECSSCTGSCILKVDDREYDVQADPGIGDCGYVTFDATRFKEELDSLLYGNTEGEEWSGSDFIDLLQSEIDE